MKALYLIVSLLSVGCGQRFTYDYAFVGPEEDCTEAKKAASEWNGCQSVHVTVSCGRDPAKETITFQPGSEVLGAPKLARGWTNGDGNITYVHTWDLTVSSIIAHEMGHSMGLAHSSHGVMGVHEDHTETVIGDDCALLDRR